MHGKMMVIYIPYIEHYYLAENQDGKRVFWGWLVFERFATSTIIIKS
jgi:hypothetical protein